MRELVRLRPIAANLGVTIKLSLETLNRMRRLASQYGKKEIADLAEKIHLVRSRFSTSHLMRLLTLRGRKARDSIMWRSVRASWTLSRLDLAVQVARRSRRVGVGRKPVIPRFEKQRLVMLEGLTLKWLRWTGSAESQLPTELLDLVREADTAVTAVKNALASHLPREPDVRGKMRTKVTHKQLPARSKD
jgi:hypothetical protein